jgi:hypothetical protein
MAGGRYTALAPVERAVGAFHRLEYRPDAARAVFLRGRALLRGGRRIQAADAFTDARQRFGEISAVVWGIRSRSELARRLVDGSV